MSTFVVTRPTIADAPQGLPVEQWKRHVPDSALRRHLSWGGDFDFRAVALEPIPEHWSEDVKAVHNENQTRIVDGLRIQFGELEIEKKIENFKAIGAKPMSVLAYHNSFFEQARNAFVIGSYYPALVASCALGERILNHLLIDLRHFFSNTAEYRRVHRKNSFDNWDVPIDILEKWDVLLSTVANEFRSLKRLRHRSIHFSNDTYGNLKDDALASIRHVSKIIELQFGTFNGAPWFIPGTKGFAFIRKSFEDRPFVQTYFLPNCPFVGTFFGLGRSPSGNWEVYDVPDYGDGTCTDDEFAVLFNERDSTRVLAERPSLIREY